ncbi:MAG: AMP-binding protein [Planctomycetes bacterium]|nr:AMP-binding protein [Planctomycetota bacterium]
MTDSTTTALPRTLGELVDALAAGSGALAVYDRRGKTKVERPYPEVARRARAWGAWLEAQGVRPGDLVYLCLPTSHELIEGFLGASLVGALPCCLALPRAIGGLDVFRRRVEQLARFGRGHLVTTPEVGAELGAPFLAPPDPLDLERLVDVPRLDPGAIAYVQLTSGSTSVPKAVAITHANLAANTAAIYTRGAGSPAETYVSWLPLYHDMGLVGILFTAMFHGCSLALMTPETFVGTPRRWFEAMTDVRKDHTIVTSAPNFGYQWAVDRIPAEKVAGLDLSRWRVACCGAEMVRPATLEEFAARFRPAGFDPGALIPCYGMAEATLAVTMSPAARGPVVVDGSVSCGPAVDGLEVTIRPVDGAPERARAGLADLPESGPGGGGSPGEVGERSRRTHHTEDSDETLPEGTEGEIVIRGSSVFPGYFLDPEATAAVLHDGLFRTGDLGYLRGGELHVTGRVKDLIILDGANVAPHELEWLAQAHVDLDGGRAAAFSVEHRRREVPVLVVEVKEVPPPEAVEALRAAVARDVAPLHDLVFVRRGTVPKTSSGKVQRGQVRARYLDGTLEGVLWRWAQATAEGGEA